MSAPSNYGKAVLKDGIITIQIPVSTLPLAMEVACGLQAIEPRFSITDPELFAPDFVHELNREDEQGTTPIHRLFDKAMYEAIGQGAEGVDEGLDDPFYTEAADV